MRHLSGTDRSVNISIHWDFDVVGQTHVAGLLWTRTNFKASYQDMSMILSFQEMKITQPGSQSRSPYRDNTNGHIGNATSSHNVASKWNATQMEPMHFPKKHTLKS